MNKFLKFFLIFLFFTQSSVLIGLGVFSYLQYSELQYWESIKFEKLNFVENYDITEESEQDQYRKVKPQEIDVDELKITGWIPDWDYQDALDEFKVQASNFSSISPFWYDLDADGSLKLKTGANDIDLINTARSNDVEIIPSITAFDAATISKVLNDPNKRDRNINEIVSVLNEFNYSGIDLDYESMYLRDNEVFYKYLQKLSVELVKNDKKLVFTALPKWGERDVVYLGFPETRKNFDYKKIADLVDELRVMTYEYAGKTNAKYGPVQPLAWQEDVIRYAIWSGVPREKLTLGVGTFGYDFPAEKEELEIDYFPVLGLEFGGGTGFAYYNSGIAKIEDELGLKKSFNNQWGEAIGEYKTKEGESRRIVYQNQQSIDLRKELAAKYGIRGVSYWRIGDGEGLVY